MMRYHFKKRDVGAYLSGFYKLSEKYLCLISFFIGLLTFFASAPFFLIAFLVIPLAILADLVYKSPTTKKRAIRLFVFFFGYYFANLHWIIVALTTDSAYYAIIPFAALSICGLFALIGLLAAVPCLLVTRKFKSPTLFYFSLAFSWILGETLKAYILPWQEIGMIFAGNDYTVQIAYLLGFRGCNLLAVLLAMMPFLIMRHRYGRYIAALFIAIWVCIFLYGHIRLEENSKKPPEFHDLTILGIQSNIDAQTLASQSDDDIGVKKYMEDSQVALEVPQKNVLLIWPESAMGAYTDFDVYSNKIFKEIMEVIPKNVDNLIFGSMYFSRSDKQFFSRISLVNRPGELAEFYDKMVLVPFGEYIPSRNYFPLITKNITKSMMDITPGSTYRNIDVGGVKFAPLICFEVAFAGKIAGDAIKNADAILQISNDVWFGNSIGPYQHLAFSKMLSVIYKIPFIRISNNGISAFYDEYGLLLQSTALNKSAFVYIKYLPKRRR